MAGDILEGVGRSLAVPVTVCMTLVGTCPAGWQYFSDTLSCFYVSTNKVDQPAARAQCRSKGAELASVGSMAEAAFVRGIS